MTIWITTGGRPSNGARELAALDGFRRCLKGGGLRPTDILINWGATRLNVGEQVVRHVLNAPVRVYIACDKLKAFTRMSEAGIKTVEWTTDQHVAIEWWREHHIVVARKTLTGHSGQGIIIVDEKFPIENVADWDAPLYTKYVNKDKEFRAHVCGGKVIDVQQKIKDPEREVKTWKVRSHENGFIFARNNVDARFTPEAAQLAVDACAACGLDFGAVDIIMDKGGTCYVLEINTAPGLEGKTVESYAKAFREVAAEA